MLNSTGPTRWWIDNINGNDIFDGTTRATAFRTIQHAYDWVRCNVNANNFPQEFFLCWDGTNTITDYAGAILTYRIFGLPHDFGVTLRGEVDGNGAVRTRIGNGGDGAIHVAGECQVYLTNTALHTTSARPAAIAAYGGKLFLNNIVLYGSPGASLIEAGPVYARINLIGPLWVINNISDPLATALFNADDESSISLEHGNTITIYGNPLFSYSTIAVSRRGKIQVNGTITWSGTARGAKWKGQSGGMIQAGQSLDSWIPGDSNGTNLDGTAWII